MVNVNMPQAGPRRARRIGRNSSGNATMNKESVLGKRKNSDSNSNSNNNQARGYRKREVNLPNLVTGRGMGCGYAGIPRYMKRAKERFDNASVVSAFLDYTIATNQYGIIKNIDTIIKRHGTPTHLLGLPPLIRCTFSW